MQYQALLLNIGKLPIYEPSNQGYRSEGVRVLELALPIGSKLLKVTPVESTTGGCEVHTLLTDSKATQPRKLIFVPDGCKVSSVHVVVGVVQGFPSYAVFEAA